MADDSEPSEARAFGRYRILGEIGRGAMGTVYRALDPVIERELAIKTLHPDLPPELVAEVRGRFLREARAAGKLSHPNIVVVYDVGEQDGEAYIAMELLEGQPLKALLAGGERLPFDLAADLAAQVADALHHAHRNAIVHRDVKPANIIVADTGHAKLTDFGMAWVPSSEMTQAGAAVGSPMYMSPEQVAGKPIQARSDVFCLGLVLYEMLTGRTPFWRDGDTNTFAVMDRIAAEPHPPLHEVDAEIPAGFAAIVDRALAKRPEERHASAGEMAAALRGLPRDAGRPASLEMLGAQASALEEQKESASSRNIAAVELAMHGAMQYFTEFAKLLNSVNPVSEAPYEFLYLDLLAAPMLGEADLESKPLTVTAKQVCGQIRFRYRVLPAETLSVRVEDEDFEKCGDYLSDMSVAFETRGPEFTIKGSLPAEISLRADYAAGTIAISLVNVRRMGIVEKQLAAGELKAALDRLGRYVLGIDDEFVTAP